jgi:hypothetical protein
MLDIINVNTHATSLQFNIFLRYLVTVTANKKKVCKSNEVENRVVYKLKIMWGQVTNKF